MRPTDVCFPSLHSRAPAPRRLPTGVAPVSRARTVEEPVRFTTTGPLRWATRYLHGGHSPRGVLFPAANRATEPLAPLSLRHAPKRALARAMGIMEEPRPFVRRPREKAAPCAARGAFHRSGLQALDPSALTNPGSRLGASRPRMQPLGGGAFASDSRRFFVGCSLDVAPRRDRELRPLGPVGAPGHSVRRGPLRAFLSQNVASRLLQSTTTRGHRPHASVLPSSVDSAGRGLRGCHPRAFARRAEPTFFSVDVPRFRAVGTSTATSHHASLQPSFRSSARHAHGSRRSSKGPQPKPGFPSSRAFLEHPGHQLVRSRRLEAPRMRPRLDQDRLPPPSREGRRLLHDRGAFHRYETHEARA